MDLENDYIMLKLGSLKSCNFKNSPLAEKAYQEYKKIENSFKSNKIIKGKPIISFNKDIEIQRELICQMIDHVQGGVYVCWGNQDLTNNREAAKEYIMNFGKNEN